MKSILLYVFIGLLVVSILIGLSYAFGWIGVHQTKTIYKARQDAKREVFEQSQSYVEGKRQEALKFYQEYIKTDEEGKKVIKELVSHSFANFDESKLDSKLYQFVYDCKYK